MDNEKYQQEVEDSYNQIFLPLLKTNGEFDTEKIKNEMCDLIFVLHQVSKVYDRITGGKLSYPTYFAETIVEAYEEEVQEQYDRGYEAGVEDCKLEHGIKDEDQ